MKYVVDTCLISELVCAKPCRAVTDWVTAQPEDNLFMSVVSLGELRKGIERLPDGHKRTRLANWLDAELKPRFAGRLLPVDGEVAERWGLVCALAASQGVVVPVLDGLIAATALVHGMTLVTRNVADVRATGVLTFNPWRKE